MAKEIFISYSRKDFEKVKAIKNELDSELGIKCWMDLDGIESGEQFENKIIAAIKDHDTMLFMLSTRSMNSIYALKELKFAQLKKKRVVIVYIESCEMSDEFLFNYSMYDTIEWSNPLQHDKLLMNLRQWFGGTQQPKPTTNEPTDPEEQFRLGEKYYKENKEKEAVKWYRRAAEQGHAKAQYMVGLYYKERGDFQEANKWYLLADASNKTTDPKKQYQIAQRYYYGLDNTPKDPKEAIKWYRLAAEQGHINAQYELGQWYADKENWGEANKWFQMAAEQGDAWSQYQLGFYYDTILEAYGAPNYAEAIKWYKKSAEQGYEYAQKALARLFINGKCGSETFNERVRWIVMAANRGDEKAGKWLKEHKITPYR